MLRNGNFENATTPVGWSTTVNGTCASGTFGILSSSTNCRNSRCISDTCDSATVSLTQSFTATAGQVFNLAFYVYLVAGGVGSGSVKMNVDII